MSYRIETINPLQFPGWDEWVLSSSGYSIFHSRAWAQVLADSYGYTPYYVMLYGDGEPKASWPAFQTNSVFSSRKGVSLPFSDHCEPLLSEDDYFQQLFNGVIHCAQQLEWKSVEFRGGGRFFRQLPTATSYNLHLLELCSSEQEMLSHLRNSNRRNIKKAIKAKVEVSINKSFESVRDFYALNCLTRQHHGVPPQPFKFFKNIYHHIISQKMGIIVLAHHQGKLIAGAVFFHFGEKATYKYGASHRKYLALRPNNLVMWEAIKWYGRQGYRQFDLGRSEHDNQGLNQFKNGWGAAATQIAYYHYDLSNEAFVKWKRHPPRFFNRVFQMMPVPILRVLGVLAYRHMA